MKLFLTILLFSFAFTSFGQDSLAVQKQYFKDAYNENIAMLEGKQPYSFKRAVFATENAYHEGKLNYHGFFSEIERLSSLAVDYAEANYNNFIYDYNDKDKILLYGAIFKVLTDSIPLFAFGDTLVVKIHIPYSYDFEDTWGKKDWTKMFVSKLLYTHKGNCHSLPYLYIMIAEQLKVKAHLALAPNHIYIKHKSKKMGMYNTELTSAAFPIDGWLMASGYIHLNAIRSGIYMDTLGNKQSLALCMIDLAQGYERKFGNKDDEFVMKCYETALKYYPNYINAMLLKSEVLKRRFDMIMQENNTESPNDIFDIPKAKKLFDDYERLIVHIHKLGYRKMPERMYLNWLLDLKENQEKYANKKVIDNFKPLKTN